MGRMGPTSLTELWALIVGSFGRKIGASPASTTVDVQLKNDAGTVLQTATIAAATASAAAKIANFRMVRCPFLLRLKN